MKLNLVTCCIIAVCACFSAFSQNNHSKIIEAYGEQRFQELLSSNPGMIDILDAYVDRGLKLIDLHDKYTAEKQITRVQIRSKNNESISVEEFVQLFDSEEFNPLHYSFFPSASVQVFVLGSTNKVLIIESQQNLLN